MRCIDLFGGIGGFRLGLEKANKKRFKFVWYCDKDKYAVQTYNKNFKEKWKPTDITTIKTKNIPEFDMLCAGFPCQSFSIAGKRKGFQDTRGTIFFEICRIAQAKKPRYLFLENVKGLLNHDEGRTYKIILESLLQLGYDVEWQVLNSKNFGVPQNRERVFIIGHLRTRRAEAIFPVGESNTIFNKKDRNKQKRRKRIQSEVLPTIDSRVGALRNSGEPYILSNPHGFNDGGLKKIPNIRESAIQNEIIIYDGHHKQFTEQLGTLTGRENRTDTNWLIGNDNFNLRRLTPVECERLQGFPDGWTAGVSDTQRYKQLGNAVTVNVIQTIGEKILTEYSDIEE